MEMVHVKDEDIAKSSISFVVQARSSQQMKLAQGTLVRLCR